MILTRSCLRCLNVMLILVLALVAVAEKLEFLGAYNPPNDRNNIQFVLKAILTRPESSGNYTLSGYIRADDGDYTISGTGYAKTGKIKGYVRRTDKSGKKFEQDFDGMLIANGQTLTAKCILLSPITKVALTAEFSCPKQQPIPTNATIDVWVLVKTNNVGSRDVIQVDPDAGRLSVRVYLPGNKIEMKTVTFSPMPKVMAKGAKWDFWLDASSVPKDQYLNLEFNALYIDVSGKSPTIQFKTNTGDRVMRKTLTWSCDIDNGSNGFYIGDPYNGMGFEYRLKKMARDEFNRLSASYNTTPGAGVTTKPPVTPPVTPPVINPPSVTLRALDIKGDVVFRTVGVTDYRQLTATTILRAGMEVDVAPDSSATFQLPNGATVKLQPGTHIRIEELTPIGGQARAMVRMFMGEIIYRHLGTSTSPRGDFVLLMNEAVTSVRGTEFTIKFNSKTGVLNIDLRDGKLEFKPGHGLEPMMLEAPTTLTFSAPPPPIGMNPKR